MEDGNSSVEDESHGNYEIQPCSNTEVSETMAGKLRMVNAWPLNPWTSLQIEPKLLQGCVCKFDLLHIRGPSTTRYLR